MVFKVMADQNHGSVGSGLGTEDGDPNTNSIVEELRESGIMEVRHPEVDEKQRTAANDGDLENECRVCQLDCESGSQQEELIQLGCGCKNGLGLAHRRCAEAWFTIKGSRNCEICGLNADNVSGVADRNFMMEWNEGRDHAAVSIPTTRWRHQPVCTFVMVAVIICLFLFWFFHVTT